jgi:rhomboid protease GluP
MPYCASCFHSKPTMTHPTDGLPRLNAPPTHPFASLERLKPATPWVTHLIIVICLVVYLGYTLPSKPLGLPTSGAEAIWGQNHFWHLLTDAFVHLEIWHLAMNMSAFYVLGALVERQMGPWRFIFLILAADFVSSSFQLATGNSGIGFSGVAYAIVGYMLLARRRYLEFAMVMNDKAVKFILAFLFLCFPLTWLGILNIGNSAHFSGFIFGIAIGAVAMNRKRLLWASIAAAMLLLSFIPPLWAPWTDNFLYTKGDAALKNGNLPLALSYSDPLLARSPQNPLAHHLRGKIYRAQGEIQKGNQELDIAAKLDPERFKPTKSTTD